MTNLQLFIAVAIPTLAVLLHYVSMHSGLKHLLGWMPSRRAACWRTANSPRGNCGFGFRRLVRGSRFMGAVTQGYDPAPLRGSKALRRGVQHERRPDDHDGPNGRGAPSTLVRWQSCAGQW